MPIWDMFKRNSRSDPGRNTTYLTRDQVYDQMLRQAKYVAVDYFYQITDYEDDPDQSQAENYATYKRLRRDSKVRTQMAGALVSDVVDNILTRTRIDPAITDGELHRMATDALSIHFKP